MSGAQNGNLWALKFLSLCSQMQEYAREEFWQPMLKNMTEANMTPYIKKFASPEEDDRWILMDISKHFDHTEVTSYLDNILLLLHHEL